MKIFLVRHGQTKSFENAEVVHIEYDGNKARIVDKSL